MDITDNKFDIGEYVDKDSQCIKLSKAIDAARKWASDAMRVIILPTDTIEELENDWVAFNGMIKKNRRESDWKSIELFGLTNQDRYEKYRSDFLQDDITDNERYDIDRLSESAVSDPISGDYYEPTEINYSTIEVEKAKKWAEESNRIIIIPTRTLAELEQLWDSYQAMVLKHRRESDWMSTELFGITNLKHYEYLKNQFLKEDLSNNQDEKYGSVVESTTSSDIGSYMVELCKNNPLTGLSRLLELSSRNNGIYEDRLISNVIDDSINSIEKYTTITAGDIYYGDMPYFAPDDMIDMGIHSDNPDDNYFGAVADNDSIAEYSVKEWFEMYRASSAGFYTEFYKLSSSWVNTVRGLMEGLKTIDQDDDYSINARKQSILELGWNPDIEFTNRNRKIANECARLRMNKNITSKVIDLREFRSIETGNSVLNEDTSVSKLRPVFIVVIDNKYDYNIGVSFSHELNRVYTYNFRNQEYVIRDMSKDTNANISVFAVFFAKEEYDSIKKYITDLKENNIDLEYKYDKLFAYIFNIKKQDSDIRKVCATFVYRITSVIGVEGKGISNADETGRIYILYSGISNRYNKNRVASILNSLNRTAVVKESNYRFSESGYINHIVHCIHNDSSSLLEAVHDQSVLSNKNTKKLVETVSNMIAIKPYRFTASDNSNSIAALEAVIFNNFDIVL